MGKKGGWFSAVKKVFNSSNESKERKEKKTQKTSSKKSWFGKQKNIESDSSHSESAFATPALRSPPPERDDDFKFAEPEAEPSETAEPVNESSKTTEPQHDPTKSTEQEPKANKPKKPENDLSKATKPEVEQKKPTKSENEQSKPAHTIAYATARAAVAAKAFKRFLGKSKEEVAAIKVQTGFRRFLARRKLRALKGLVRLKVLVQSQSVKRQAVTTLRCMQTLARVQSQVRARRIRMSEENQALQRQLMQKREKELDKMKSYMGNDWDNTRRSKEQIEASMQNKEVATARRERALAYAQTQQQLWRNPSKSGNPTFMDPNNPQWGWSWLDRWMAARPWESQTATDNNEQQPVKLVTRTSSSGDMSNKLDQSSPRSPTVSSRRTLTIKPEKPPVSSPRASSPRVGSPRSTKTKSMIPTPSQNQSPIRSTSPSPLGLVKKGTVDKKPTVGSVKKRQSLSGASSGGGGRRLSGSPQVGSGTR
ncbi:hypothetical protein SSX86_020487 [Deinandra increscens subsp. villosa]|uniref:Protein IQ-DOMAIN 1 n=1 Tax=Deinandra increscens subsp. villosa TaxID=3103831 RepID=A0AAP0CUV2_9ASTR